MWPLVERKRKYDFKSKCFIKRIVKLMKIKKDSRRSFLSLKKVKNTKNSRQKWKARLQTAISKLIRKMNVNYMEVVNCFSS